MRDFGVKILEDFPFLVIENFQVTIGWYNSLEVNHGKVIRKTKVCSETWTTPDAILSGLTPSGTHEGLLLLLRTWAEEMAQQVRAFAAWMWGPELGSPSAHIITRLSYVCLWPLCHHGAETGEWLTAGLHQTQQETLQGSKVKSGRAGTWFTLLASVYADTSAYMCAYTRWTLHIICKYILIKNKQPHSKQAQIKALWVKKLVCSFHGHPSLVTRKKQTAKHGLCSACVTRTQSNVDMCSLCSAESDTMI